MGIKKTLGIKEAVDKVLASRKEEIDDQIRNLGARVKTLEERPVVPLEEYLSHPANAALFTEAVRCRVRDIPRREMFPEQETKRGSSIGLGILMLMLIAVSAFSVHNENKGMEEIAAAITKFGSWKVATLPASPSGVAIVPPSGDGKLHNLYVHVSCGCWIKVTRLKDIVGISGDRITHQADDRIMVEGNQPAAWGRVFEFDQLVHVEVRSGCPGAVQYAINGETVLPVNESAKPDESEVVNLTF